MCLRVSAVFRDTETACLRPPKDCFFQRHVVFDLVDSEAESHPAYRFGDTEGQADSIYLAPITIIDFSAAHSGRCVPRRVAPKQQSRLHVKVKILCAANTWYSLHDVQLTKAGLRFPEQLRRR